MKKICLLAAMMVAASGVQATIIDSSFVNLDFDASTSENFPDGFDSGTGYDVPGWQNAGAIVDSGLENDAWWGTFDNYSAFLGNGSGGDSAMNISTYVIQSGDQFDLSFYAKAWSLAAQGWGVDGPGELTMTLFYGSDPANVIGSVNTGVMVNSNDPADYSLYQGTIPATVASEGQTLGVLATGAGYFVNFDEVSIDVIPEPATIGLIGAFGAGLLFVRRRFMI